MIKGKQIYLTTIAESDIEHLRKLDNDLESRGLYYPQAFESDLEFRNWYNSSNGLWDDNFGRLLIKNYDDEILGYVNYFKTVGYFEALEIGYILYDREQRGKGIMTEAVKLFSDYLFRAKKITRLEIRCNPKNIGSRRVAEKAGYVFEGVNRNVARKFGKLFDLELFSYTIEDWQKEYGL